MCIRDRYTELDAECDINRWRSSVYVVSTSPRLPSTITGRRLSLVHIAMRAWRRWACRSHFYGAMHYSAKRGLAIACRFSVRLSVTLVDHDHIGWKSWRLIAQTISPTSSLFVAQRSSTYSQGNMEKFWGENVASTPTSITSGWIESTQPRVTWS